MPKLRCVPDTNVIIAFHRSENPGSPNLELFERWRLEEFDIAYSSDTLIEYTRKLLELEVAASDIQKFLALLIRLGISVQIEFFHFQHYPVDRDDIAFILCVANGNVSHLISYDTHLLDLDQRYSFRICRTVDFLHELRASGE